MDDGVNLNLESKLRRFVKELNGADGHIFGKYNQDINVERSAFSIKERKSGGVIADFRINEDCRIYGRVYPDLVKEKCVVDRILRFFGENEIVVDNYGGGENAL